MPPRFVYPPRPALTLSPDQLPEMEESGMWVAQRKFNGTRCIACVGDGEVQLWTRHAEPPKQYVLSDALKDSFLEVAQNQNIIFDGELLHSKTKGVKGVFVLFDILYVGKYLFNTDQMSRYERLKIICGDPKNICDLGIGLQISKNLWLAEVFEKNFVEEFDRYNHLDEIEGLVLRRKSGRLTNFGRNEYESGDLVRVRKPHVGGLYTH